MKITVNHYHHFCPAPDMPPPAWALQILAALQSLETKMANQFDTLTAAVAANTSVVNSAKELLDGFVARLTALELSDADDQAKIDAFAADVQASADALAASVAANTPAAPTPPV